MIALNGIVVVAWNTSQMDLITSIVVTMDVLGVTVDHVIAIVIVTNDNVK